MRQREQLILALLQQSSWEKAATSVGMSRVTAWRISQTAEFQQEYRKARWQAYSQSLARLQQASGAAVSTLLKVMVDKATPPASRVRAAECVLDHAGKATEVENVEARVSGPNGQAVRLSLEAIDAIVAKARHGARNSSGNG